MNSGWSFAPSSSSLALSFWAWSNSVFSESFLNGGRRQLLGRKRITGGCEWIELMASLLRLRLAIDTIWNRNGIDIHPASRHGEWKWNVLFQFSAREYFPLHHWKKLCLPHHWKMSDLEDFKAIWSQNQISAKHYVKVSCLDRMWSVQGIHNSMLPIPIHQISEEGNGWVDTACKQTNVEWSINEGSKGGWAGHKLRPVAFNQKGVM